MELILKRINEMLTEGLEFAVIIDHLATEFPQYSRKSLTIIYDEIK